MQQITLYPELCALLDLNRHEARRAYEQEARSFRSGLITDDQLGLSSRQMFSYDAFAKSALIDCVDRMLGETQEALSRIEVFKPEQIEAELQDLLRSRICSTASDLMACRDTHVQPIRDRHGIPTKPMLTEPAVEDVLEKAKARIRLMVLGAAKETQRSIRMAPKLTINGNHNAVAFATDQATATAHASAVEQHTELVFNELVSALNDASHLDANYREAAIAQVRELQGAVVQANPDKAKIGTLLNGIEKAAKFVENGEKLVAALKSTYASLATYGPAIQAGVTNALGLN